MRLPKELDRQFRVELKAYEEKKMPYITSVERLGREEGIEQGLRAGLLDGIELALKLKFGVAGQDLVPEVRALTDLSIIRQVYARLETATTIEEVRQAWL